MMTTSRLAGLKKTQPSTPPAPPPSAAEQSASAATKRPAREGKRAIVGYFSPKLSRELNMWAVENDSTLQAIIGEAIDLWLRDKGQAPVRRAVKAVQRWETRRKER